MDKVVLVEPEKPGNTGFIARLAQNFDAELRIVEPEFNLSEARKTANKSQEKLREAELFENFEEAIEDLGYVVGTKPGRGTPLKDFSRRKNSSIVIGRESSGLSNRELEKCDAVVHIETGDYSSLNQSHAAAVLMHGFFDAEKEADTELLEKASDGLGEKTLELLKRASPTEKEVRAVLGELKSRS
jgi:TrmH family RNA methyltransferase